MTAIEQHDFVIERANTLLRTAMIANRQPVRWRMSRLYDRKLRSYSAMPYQTDMVKTLFGYPYEVDDEAPVGIGLVVREW